MKEEATSAIKTVLERFGIGVLDNHDLFLAAFRDLAPRCSDESLQIDIALKSGFGHQIRNASISPDYCNSYLNSAVTLLESKVSMTHEKACDLVLAFSSALGMNFIDESPRPKGDTSKPIQDTGGSHTPTQFSPQVTENAPLAQNISPQTFSANKKKARVIFIVALLASIVVLLLLITKCSSNSGSSGKSSSSSQYSAYYELCTNYQNSRGVGTIVNDSVMPRGITGLCFAMLADADSSYPGEELIVCYSATGGSDYVLEVWAYDSNAVCLMAIDDFDGFESYNSRNPIYISIAKQNGTLYFLTSGADSSGMWSTYQRIYWLEDGTENSSTLVIGNDMDTNEPFYYINGYPIESPEADSNASQVQRLFHSGYSIYPIREGALGVGSSSKNDLEDTLQITNDTIAKLAHQSS